MLSARNRSLQTGSTTTDYAVFGKGNRPLVMLPGLNTRGVKGSALMLSVMYRMFAKTHRIYVIDRKNHIPAGYTVRDMAHDTAEAMEQLGITQADVIGISQGGMIAQYLAIDHPHLVHKLVLGVTLSRNNPTVETVVGNWITTVKNGDLRAFTADMLDKMYSEAYVRKYRPLLPLLTVLNRPQNPERFLRLAEACLTCCAYAELDKITCPVLVLGGRKDKIVTGEASIEITEKLGCDLYLYDDLGHAAYEEATDFNRRILEFLNK